MDSDKDGMTNGEELGDSSCKWRPGHPAPALPIGHPGLYIFHLCFYVTHFQDFLVISRVSDQIIKI